MFFVFVKDPDLMAFRKKSIDQMGTDEAISPKNQHVHLLFDLLLNNYLRLSSFL
jgi:hypothetical protein